MFSNADLARISRWKNAAVGFKFRGRKLISNADFISVILQKKIKIFLTQKQVLSWTIGQKQLCQFHVCFFAWNFLSLNFLVETKISELFKFEKKNLVFQSSKILFKICALKGWALNHVEKPKGLKPGWGSLKNFHP